MPQPVARRRCTDEYQCVRAADVRAAGALPGLDTADVVVTLRMRHGDEAVRLSLVTTCPQYGGRRWWLVCPACSRRCGVLYRVATGQPFACRRCHGLTYRTQRMARAARWEHRAGRLQMRALWRGIHLADDGLYYKPRGMHWRTFHALIDDFETFSNAAAAWRLRGVLRPNSWLSRALARPTPRPVAP